MLGKKLGHSVSVMMELILYGFLISKVIIGHIHRDMTNIRHVIKMAYYERR